GGRLNDDAAASKDVHELGHDGSSPSTSTTRDLPRGQTWESLISTVQLMPSPNVPSSGAKNGAASSGQKIGIIGTGNMGRLLGALWAELGHEVLFGARDVARAREAAALCPARSRSGTNDEAAAFGELVYLNPRDVPMRELLARPDVLDGKIVVDSHNGPMPRPFELLAPARSRSELLQAELPKARVVKAFNTMAQEVFDACPERIAPAHISVFVAGDDDEARTTVMRLASEMGFVPVDCGGIASARLLEVLGDLARSFIGARSDLRTTFSVHSAPEGVARFGPRAPSRLP
ncbi:MAG: NAD(P)-binding domain-containing protein, partial [Kofleriaceae bacterium]